MRPAYRPTGFAVSRALILAERQYRAQASTACHHPWPRRLGARTAAGRHRGGAAHRVGANAENAEWDSRKRQDGNWQIQLQYTIGSRTSTAEWIYDPRKRHVIPDDDEAVRLCLPQEEWAAITFAERQRATATVTPIGSRQHVQPADSGRENDRWAAPGLPRSRAAGQEAVAADADAAAAIPGVPAGAAAGTGPGAPAAAVAGGADQPEPGAVPSKKAAGSRSRRASVPSWDEIMFGTSRQQD